MADAYIEDGFLIEEFDGGRTRKCITEECIRENYETGGNTEKSHCSCEECVTKRLGKDDDGLRQDGWTVEELKENLPEEIWNELQDYLSSPDDSPPGKEQDNVSVATQEEDEEEDVEKALFTPYEKPDSGYEDVEDEDTSGALGLFYEGVGD